MAAVEVEEAEAGRVLRMPLSPWFLRVSRPLTDMVGRCGVRIKWNGEDCRSWSGPLVVELLVLMMMNDAERSFSVPLPFNFLALISFLVLPCLVGN